MPSEPDVIPQSGGGKLSIGTNDRYLNNKNYTGRIHIHSVVIPPISRSTAECGYDLVQNTIRSRRSSTISNKGEEMAPLCIGEEITNPIAAYM